MYLLPERIHLGGFIAVALTSSLVTHTRPFQDVLHGLKSRGHQVVKFEWYGNVVAILRRPGEAQWHAAYDYRHNSTGGMDGD